MGVKHYTKEEVASWPEGHKACRSCNLVLPASMFHRDHKGLMKLHQDCKACRGTKGQRAYVRSKEGDPRRLLYNRAKSRAKVKGIEFSITWDDIQIPEVCPVFGVPMAVGIGRNSYSLDRIDSTKGYIPGNVAVISWRANVLKGDGTVEELENILRWMKEQGV